TAFAVIRGALKEVGTLAALGGAAAAGWFLAKPTVALFTKGDSFLTLAAVGGALALLAFAGLYFILHVGLRRIPLKGASERTDRVIGGVFGLARGLALIGLGFLAYSYYLDEARRPNAVNKAMMLPLAKTAAGFFEALAPAAAGDLDGEGPKAGAQENAAADGYGRSDRAGLSEIVTTVTTTAETPSPVAQKPAGADAIAAALSELDPE
ncbi:MAG: CvpA family protein, partial [Parvularculaceae bacterium]